MNPNSSRLPSLPVPRRASRPRAAFASLSLVTGLAAVSSPATAQVDPRQLPPAASREVSFAADIQPIFERSCLRCHGPEAPKSGFRLDNKEAALAGGDGGEAILPGNSGDSPLIHYVARIVEDMEMPPAGRGEPLTTAEIGLLRAWIDQGAPWSDATREPAIDFEITPSLQFIAVDGNAARFREHTWTREGWGGGVADFRLKYAVDPRTQATLEGRALSGRDDFRFNARVTRADLGWARLAYREFSRFQDDTGGYYAPFGTPAPRWGDDFVLRRRQTTVEFGLTLPDWPTVRVAYDLETRDGTEATLNWGGITEGAVTRNLFPGRKQVDETTHRISLDLGYDWRGLRISNQTQFEWYDQDNRRTQYEIANGPFTYATKVTDQQDYWRGANVLRIERNVRDWLYLSGGYLYSHLSDYGGFGVESFSPSDPSLPPTLDLTTDDLTLRRQSHVMNGNFMVGPWEQLQVYGGLQAEWTRQEGFATGSTYGTGTLFNSSNDRAATDENFGLRYAGIPATIVYVETRFQQETYSQFEEGLSDGQPAFLRDTDADGDSQDYEAGVSVSPWRRVSLHAKVRHRDRRSRYDHPRDLDVFSSGNGYPAFIRARDTSGDEVEARLVVQPLSWLKTTLKYGVSATDFETATDSWDDLAPIPPVTQAGGRILAGTYDAHTVSAGLVVTPWQRLHLATTLYWITSRSLSGVNNEQEVVPYQGETWNLLASSTYLLDEKTDLLLTYLFSDADYTQDNAAAGLPLGIAYTRHAATIGVARRLKHDRVVRVEYGFFDYDEPTLGGAADYTAHGLFASFRFPWR